MRTIKLYSRPGCHLCQDALNLLQVLQTEFSFEIKEINIDESDELTEKYGLEIPVIEDGDQVVVSGIIDVWTLSEYLSKTNL